MALSPLPNNLSRLAGALLRVVARNCNARRALFECAFALTIYRCLSYCPLAPLRLRASKHAEKDRVGREAKRYLELMCAVRW